VAIPHCLCDHVIRNPGKPGQYIHLQCYHEPDGEYVGHIRLRHKPWYSFDPGERYSPENDGKLIHVPEKAKEEGVKAISVKKEVEVFMPPAKPENKETKKEEPKEEPKK
jgi:hypothetical protein